jgi:hypothetical protein
MRFSETSWKTSADRSVRSLKALQRTGSTSRVLNLISALAKSPGDPLMQEMPFFLSPVLNKSIVLKHRLRQDEFFLFDDVKPNVTKVILPFDVADLSLGGKSVFIGQRGWKELIRDACNDAEGLSRDLEVLELMDILPSLDPFLLREHLGRYGYRPAPGYFAISQSDLERMQAFVTVEIDALIRLAYRGGGAAGGTQTARLVAALLSNELDERLEPLRRTLMLEGDSFREGIFCWKGFLYYKWMLKDLWGPLTAVMTEVGELIITGNTDYEAQRYIASAKRRLQKAIAMHRARVTNALKVYDDAFRDLTHNGRPQAFRQFLLNAPDMFLTLGEKVGAVSHVASFWRFRFPAGQRPVAPMDEAVSVLQEFEASMGVPLDD